MKTNFILHWLTPMLLSSILSVVLFVATFQPVLAATGWYVTPSGAGSRSGQSWENAFSSIQQALDVAQTGDTIYLGNGDYYEDLTTKRHGAANAPIVITGAREAVVRGSGGAARVFQIFHDYYRLEGWTINGYDGSGNSAADYRDKLLYVHGQAAAYGGEVRRGPRGLEVSGMQIMNAGGECIRLRYFVQNANIHHNMISNCGRHDFVFGAGGKNGEGIYMGTSSNQWGDGKNPTNEADGTNANHIHHNIFNTQANECVEVKEGGTGNIIEYNDCTGGLDPEAAGLAARGDGNIFRYNKSYSHAGGGLRFGGHLMNGHQYGVGNEAYGNTFFANALGGIKFEIGAQNVICGNILSGPNGQNQANPAFGSYASEYTALVGAECTNGSTGGVPPTATATTPPTATPKPINTPLPPTATPVILPTATLPPVNTPLPPTATPAIPATATPVILPTATPPTINTPLPPTPTPVIANPGQVIYLSAAAERRIGNLRFMDEDIVAFDQTTQRWRIFFDGSDVGLSKADVDAFALLPDGSLLISFITATETPGLGQVDDSDVVRFVAEHLGATTAGSFEFYFDGSDVGLLKDSEDIDALSVLADGSLLLSTTGVYAVWDIVGVDSDLLLFRPQRLGVETAGIWSRYFIGADHELKANSDEDINGVWLDPNNTNLYLNTRGKFAVNQLIGDNEDLFVCPLQVLSPCGAQLYWAGDQHDFAGDNTDAFEIGNTAIDLQLIVAANSAEEADSGWADDVEPAEEAQNNDAEQLQAQLFLPAIGR